MYLDKGELAAALSSVSDSHLTILVHPPLSTQHIVDARGDLFPLVVIFISVSEGGRKGRGGGKKERRKGGGIG